MLKTLDKTMAKQHWSVKKINQNAWKFSKNVISNVLKMLKKTWANPLQHHSFIVTIRKTHLHFRRKCPQECYKIQTQNGRPAAKTICAVIKSLGKILTKSNSFSSMHIQNIKHI